jgi:UDP-glucose 4-epimerase
LIIRATLFVMTSRILVTGGLGYIGSHTCVELINAGHTPIIIDNLATSKRSVLDHLEEITGQDITFFDGDIRDHALLDHIFKDEKPDSVMHFAGLKSVGESIEKPLDYFSNNIKGTLYLLQAMEKFDVKSIVFSSSANVYGNDNTVPNTEDMPAGNVTNPYGRTKHMIEVMLNDMAHAHPDWSIVTLRYYNPIGAHDSGLIGEDPMGIPSNIMPYIAKVAKGDLPCISVYGDDYETIDGTGVRDYIHVVDLARGHVACINKLVNKAGHYTYNLGTGQGTSVLQLIASYERACGHKIAYKICSRRDGDIAKSYADVSKIKNDLGWAATKTIDDACVDSWRWMNATDD